jgi:ABC-type bacteriocin/lantibiotic exporter with double-glycine peptidase domain
MFTYFTTAMTDLLSLKEKEIYINKMVSILNIPETDKKLLPRDEPIEIMVNNVNYSYKNNPAIFSGLRFHFPANTTTVIAGRNGTGKSTLIKMITRRLLPSQGTILYNNHNINAINDAVFQKLISCYSDTECLFNITLQSNLLHENTKEGMDRLCELIDRFNLKYLIDSLPNGLDTIVEKSGASFSGGEKQRLLLIRTLLLESRILLFDEPTSALDLENERIFMNYIKELRGKKTIILITHKESYFDSGDFLINFDDS